jgi:hypothetical protein
VVNAAAIDTKTNVYKHELFVIGSFVVYEKLRGRNGYTSPHGEKVSKADALYIEDEPAKIWGLVRQDYEKPTGAYRIVDYSKPASHPRLTRFTPNHHSTRLTTNCAIRITLKTHAKSLILYAW